MSMKKSLSLPLLLLLELKTFHLNKKTNIIIIIIISQFFDCYYHQIIILAGE